MHSRASLPAFQTMNWAGIWAGEGVSGGVGSCWGGFGVLEGRGGLARGWREVIGTLESDLTPQGLPTKGDAR